MPISRRQFLTLLEGGVIRITPYDQTFLKDNHYVIHNNGKISFYEENYGMNTVIDSSSPPKLTEIDIPQYGYTLEPNRIYKIVSRESVISDDWSCSPSPVRGLSEYGLLINVDSDVDYKCGGPVVATLTSIHPLIIYQGQEFAELYVQENEPGIGYVPIGGIIGWSGGTPPYGYRVCDGTHGTPDLRNKFIVGGTTFGETGSSNTQTLTIENIPEHSHQYKKFTHTQGSAGVGELSVLTDATEISGFTDSTGSGTPFDNRPEFVTMIFIMRYK